MSKSSDPPAKPAKKVQRIGKYEVLRQLGAGGMGAVFLVRDTTLNREAALKLLPPELATNKTMVDRFKKEAEHAAKLRDDNIVSVYEFGPFGGTFYLAMEYVNGVDLHEY